MGVDGEATVGVGGGSNTEGTGGGKQHGGRAEATKSGGEQRRERGRETHGQERAAWSTVEGEKYTSEIAGKHMKF